MGFLSVATAGAALPQDQLLPSTTKGVVFIPNWEQLETAFDSTQLGQLLQDPVMRPFYEDLKQQLKDKGTRRLEKLGVTVDDLRGIPGGEIAVAVILPAADRAAQVVVVDVTGHEQETVALRKKIAANLTKQGAKRTARATDELLEFVLPKREGEKKAQTAVSFFQGQTLVLGDDYDVCAAMYRSLGAPRKDNLAGVKAYQAVQARLQKAAGALTPHARWYVDPFGFADASKILNPPAEKPKGPDLLKILRNQGFTAVQAIGGYVNFSDGQHELLHRTFVYAPAVPGKEALTGGDKYNLAARMLEFPAGGTMPVQNWVPREIATYNTFNWSVQKGFAASETLVDEYMNEKGVFRDVLDSLRDDPDGPRVDMEKELIANLGKRVTLITDYQLPINPKSERLLFAMEATNEAAVAAAIGKSMKNDPAVRALDANGNPKDKNDTSGITIWEVTNEPASVPELMIETPGGGILHSDLEPTAFQQPKAAPGRRRPGRKPNPNNPNGNQQARTMPNSAVAVVHGHLFVSSHKDFLIKVLQHANTLKNNKSDIVTVGLNAGLETSADLNMVLMEMEQGFALEPAQGFTAGKQHSLRIFSRTDEEFRPTYELVRSGQMPKSETMVGKMLNGLLGDGKEGTTRQQKIDGSKLPEFDVVRRYLGPAGAFLIAENEGWLLTGFTLRKQVSSAEVTSATRR